MTVIAARARLRHKLARMIETEIQAFARTKDQNPDSPEYAELAERIARRLEGDIKRPSCPSVGILADDDGKGGYKNVRAVEWTGCAEEMLYPMDPKTGEPVEDPVADFFLTLPDPAFLEEM